MFCFKGAWANTFEDLSTWLKQELINYCALGSIEHSPSLSEAVLFIRAAVRSQSVLHGHDEELLGRGNASRSTPRGSPRRSPALTAFAGAISHLTRGYQFVPRDRLSLQNRPAYRLAMGVVGFPKKIPFRFCPAIYPTISHICTPPAVHHPSHPLQAPLLVPQKHDPKLQTSGL